MSPEDAQMLKEGLTNITDGSLISKYFEDRWQALVFGKGTGQCDSCHGCCRADYIIGLSKAEAAEIPHTVVDGHAVILPDEHGVCPYLIDNACSIYEKRPMSCRHFDCRDMAFAGLLITDDDSLIGIEEMNVSILRHIRNNGKKILRPMRLQAVQILEQFENNAVKAAQGALIVGLLKLMPTEKSEQLMKTLDSDDEREREAAQNAGVKQREESN